jgi:hypothetical protein
MEYTWTIAQLERNTADDFVTDCPLSCDSS